MDTSLPAEHQNCNLCNATDVRVVSLRDRDGRPLRTVMCTGCGLVRCDPMPDPDMLDQYYRERYRIDYKRQRAPSRRHILRAGRVALDRLARLPQLPAPSSSGGRALDIGAGGGEFAYLLGRTSGLAVTGIEPNEGYAAHARQVLGLDLVVSPLHEAMPAGGSFDLITMFHVLEHLRDPGAALARIAAWLAPGGLAVVEVPNIEATCQAPGHLFHAAHLYNFNAAALERLGQKAGLEPVACWFSADRGNLSLTLRRPAAQTLPAMVGSGSASVGALAMPSNAARVWQVRSAHTSWRHHATLQPVTRALRRMASRVDETLALQRLPVDPRAMLDRLCDGWQAPRSGQTA
ncbi:MAG: class I SAM-dependent methyltransferase [Rhodocyclaceae bacterium]|jgi:2-polyprenyl-3-methyl-5-hydroxy-6-metoxy-1,4-benzoquinol methylase|nr:class I SAM-dependent methyltransferase [Rhodocyclaceae bacterium]MCE2981643.1 class I SAM-dependent methyltransferase [Betaproteobacteria bacterium]MCA3073459.1 class I SAM-dependent methyltransferase [Rhodocyclaceae bacterium]MCA3089502.1 class I SAM-dependent methyltransferase [Rhodocyclaceae bacterium]MCA3093063.1 class I SAM-dependent methyltransferase [Rhodocyclaceae bacterium]